MDQSPLQQTMMDFEASPVPHEVDLSLSPSSSPNITQAYEPVMSYDELFPALPLSGPNLTVSPSVETQSSAGWGKETSNMRIQSTVITQVFRVPHEERTRIDGNNQFGENGSSRICADITAKTGAHIEISAAKDQSLTFLVTGKSEAVVKARRLVLEKFQTQARQIIKIPKDHHRFILGKKGKRLQDLEQITATKIQVPNANDTSEDIVVIGPKEGIEKAVHEIQVTSDEQSKQAYEKMDIPKMYHPFICGANNEKINALMAENNVRINVPPPSVNKDEITIAGEKEGVLRCKEIVARCYKEMEKKCQTVSVEVPKSQHRYIIGPRGVILGEILTQTGVSVEMPSSESNSDTITLRGPHDKLGQALTMVYSKANSVVMQEVEAPAWLHKFIIGRKGANIRQITQDYPKVHIEFTDKQGKIHLEGPPEELEEAREKLEAMIQEMKDRLTIEEVAIDPKFYKHIIGKAGANVNRIRSETGVLVNISQNNNIIVLEGSPDGVQQAKKDLTELVSKMENEKERDIIIEQRFHRNIIGAKGDKIREIRDQFNQVQISFPGAGDQSDIVKIRGPKEDVDHCFKFMQRHVKEMMEASHQVKVVIFRQFHKNIIGKGGVNINKIREETGTRIDLPHEGQNCDEIVITGKKENCEKARNLIQKIQSELANIVEVDIIIPSKHHNALIGSGGRLIRSIADDCGGVHIKFPPAESNSEKVTIRGPKDDVAKAKAQLVKLSNEKQEAGFTAEVRAKPQHHRFIIGKNGSNINKIRDATGARIMFPTEKDADKEVIVITGTKDQISKAKAQLEAAVKELDLIIEDTMSVDPKYHRHFVARRGEVLRQISDQYGGVTVSFPRIADKGDKVVLKGAKECVHGAKLRIQEMVSDFEQMTSIEVIIPQKFHRTIMGARGTKVQALTAEFDVQIKFPDRDLGQDEESGHHVNGDANVVVKEGIGEPASPRPQDIVRVIGKSENCEAAREALLGMVPITIEVPVPFKYHRYVIGQKGERVKSMMSDYDVNIQVPPAQDQRDVIRVSGTPQNVEAARIAFEERVVKLDGEEEDRHARSFQVTVDVDPEYHPKIIGKRGAVITQIREKYDVNVQFPDRGDANPQTITITGYEANCHEAKEAILKITGDLESLVKVYVEIDARIHARLIGQRGKSIRKVMDDYKVEVKFPRGEEDPNTVVIIGQQEAVDECKEHLLNVAEEFAQDLADREEISQYTRGGGGYGAHGMGGEHGGRGVPGRQEFVVSNAPWAQPPNMDSSEDFPSMGAPAVTSTGSAAWGPRR